MKRGTILPLIFISSIIILESCSIHPVAWNPDKTPSYSAAVKFNEKLTSAIKIDLNKWEGPEDIEFDNSGNLYCGVHNKDFTDGRILKIDPSGKVEEFYNSGSWVSGLHYYNNNLIALSHKEGLISINQDKKASVLADKDEDGNRFYIPNGIDIAHDGKIYFSNTSEISAYNIKYGRKLILEMKPRGGVYCFNPNTNYLTTLMKGTFFGNGLVLSKDEDYLLIVETTKYRVLKYWIEGEKKGRTEIFIDNLPGFPNGISIREDGSYWLGFTTKRNEALDKIHPKVNMKKLVYCLPQILQPKADKFGMIMNISADGKILETLYDTKGVILSEAGAVKEHKGFLYIGGDVIRYIGKYKLQ